MTRFLKVGSSYVMAPSGGAFALVPPTVSVSLVSGALYEGATATFRIALTKEWIASIEVDYATSNGTGSAGTDYTSTSGTATIPIGDEFVDVTVPTTLRAGSQASRTFTFTISGAVDDDAQALTITTPAVTATILDTESAPEYPTLTIAAVAPADEGDPLTFRVTSSAPFSEDITFTYATSNGTATAGTDYTSASGTGTLTAETLTEDLTVTTTLRSGFQGARTVVMTISDAETASAAPITITTAAATGTIAETEVPTGEHSLFEWLVGHANHWKSNSMRDPTALNATMGSGTKYVTYSPETDTDPEAQDAAKCVIPAFSPSSGAPQARLAAPCSDTDTLLYLEGGSLWLPDKVPTACNAKGMVIKVDDEYMLATTATFPLTVATGTYAILQRGYLGSTPAAHAQGARFTWAINSLINTPFIPVVSEDGYTYLFHWASYWTDSYFNVGTNNHKAFHFRSNSLWMEPQTRFAGSELASNPAYDPDIHLAAFTTRCYNQNWDGVTTDYTLTDRNMLGPNTTVRDPLGPIEPTHYPLLRASTWVHFFVVLEQNANDWDRYSYWIADEHQGLVQILDRVQVSLEPNTKSGGAFNEKIEEFQVEYNTSDTGLIRGDTRDLVTYFKNFAILRWPNGEAPTDWSPFLLAPGETPA